MLKRRIPSYHRAKSRLSILFGCAVVAGTVPMTEPAYAWKPYTHAYLAQIVLEDARDGTIEIPELGSDRVHAFELSEDVREALTGSAAHYRAGALGPDAYPDMATGQMYIHPGFQLSRSVGGSDGWLSHVWQNFDTSPKERAFRLGFLAHAAGDVYGHSFVNHFAGGPFTIEPVSNATRHIVVEGYIEKLLPAAAFETELNDVSISGLEAKIYHALVNAYPGSALSDDLMREDSPAADLSVPRYFSTLRAKLDAEIEDWQQMGSAERIFFAQQAFYKIAWRDDIDSGLAAWPEVSHEVAKALFLNRSGPDIDRAKSILSRYGRVHVTSMLGAPDFVGLAAQEISELKDRLLPIIPDPLDPIENWLLDQFLLAGIGMTRDEIEAYLADPESLFDALQIVVEERFIAQNNPIPRRLDVSVTRRVFDERYLHIRSADINNPNRRVLIEEVPALYNSVVLIKMSLLEPHQVANLIKLLNGISITQAGSSTALASDRVLTGPMARLIALQPSQNEPLVEQVLGRMEIIEKIKLARSRENIVLGLVESLDGSRQWRNNSLRHEFVMMTEDCIMYNKVFKPLPGNGSCRGWTYTPLRIGGVHPVPPGPLPIPQP